MKYFVPKAQFDAFLADIGSRVTVDAYHKDHPQYTICNIYYDTPDFDLIRASLAHPRYKEKLRLRSYGVPGLDTESFLEIKKKYDGAVNKRRIRMALRDSYAYMEQGVMPEKVNPQVLREIDYFRHRLPLYPRVYLAYDRLGFFSKAEPDLRITFDDNIRWRNTDLRLEHGDYGRQLLTNDVYLMEVKAEKQVPLWLANAMSRYRFPRVSFSKYGTVYQTLLAESQNKEIPRQCLLPYLAPSAR